LRPLRLVLLAALRCLLLERGMLCSLESGLGGRCRGGERRGRWWWCRGRERTRSGQRRTSHFRCDAKRGRGSFCGGNGRVAVDLSCCGGFSCGGDTGPVDEKKARLTREFWWAHVTWSKRALGRLILGAKPTERLLGGCWRLELMSAKYLVSASI